MGNNIRKRNSRLDIIYMIGLFVLLVITAYYLIIEHTAHFLEFAGVFAILLILLILVLVKFGVLRPLKKP